MKRGPVVLVENPMVRAFGRHPDGSRTCATCCRCKRQKTKNGRAYYPTCDLRRKKACDPKWPACSKHMSTHEECAATERALVERCAMMYPERRTTFEEDFSCI